MVDVNNCFLDSNATQMKDRINTVINRTTCNFLKGNLLYS